MAGRRKKKGTTARSIVGWAATFAVIALIVAASVLSLYLYLEFLGRQRQRDGFTSQDLVIPEGGSLDFKVEDPPLFIQGGPTPQYSCRLMWPVSADTGLMTGYEGFGAMFNFQMINSGPNDIYVEKVHVATGWGETTSRTVGKYINTEAEVFMCHLFIPIPDPLPDEGQWTYSVSVSVLIEGPTTWVRGKDVDFDTSSFDLIPTGPSDPDMTFERNTYYLYDRIVPKVEGDMPRLISIAENNSLGRNENFGVQDIADVFDFVKQNIEYKADSSSSADQWFSPCETLDRGGGDCEDWAMLFSGMITAIGGTSRVIVTEGHAFSSVYLGDSTTSLNDLEDRYGTTIPFIIWEDDLGTWLIVEPQSNLIFGWPPIDCLPARDPTDNMSVFGMPGMGWICEGSDTISIVDIYL